MRQISLREFRVRGAAALKAAAPGEPVVLAGRGGPAYILIPVEGNFADQERELLRAQALASLKAGWLRARRTGLSQLSAAEIDREVTAARREARRRDAAHRR
jgi:antitoxin (DNA-binding transcriptional repressor) of toxin-antitoxin stability system